MADISIFENEINLIKDDNLREFVRIYLSQYVPEYFWHCGASSSGKYHPAFAQGEGGLVRHTKAVVMFCVELLRMSSYAYMKDIYKDYAIAACICHDTCKYGIYDDEMDTTQYQHHGKLAAELMDECWAQKMENWEAPALLLIAVESHMGQWSADDRPFTNIDRLVHLADYCASRNFIDIPSLAE